MSSSYSRCMILIAQPQREREVEKWDLTSWGFSSIRFISKCMRLRSLSFFFSSRRRHTTWPRDWSSDVCSSDLIPHDGRMGTVHQAIRAGLSVAELAAATGMDPWFIDQIKGIEEQAERIRRGQPEAPGRLPSGGAPRASSGTGPSGAGPSGPSGAVPSGPTGAVPLTPDMLRAAKAAGFSDAQIAQIRGTTETQIRWLRHALGVRPVYHTVDTCAAEFAARTPYLYSTYDTETEVPDGDRPKVIILGSGPNRIGQGIEFDYACVHASFALSAAGY